MFRYRSGLLKTLPDQGRQHLQTLVRKRFLCFEERGVSFLHAPILKKVMLF